MSLGVFDRSEFGLIYCKWVYISEGPTTEMLDFAFHLALTTIFMLSIFNSK